MSVAAASEPVLPPGSAGVEAITPVRIMDSRTAIGGRDGEALAPNETHSLPVAGRGAVPTFGVAAVLINVTVVPGNSAGYITIYPGGQSRPLASNINFKANSVVANQALVPVGGNGKINIYNLSGNTHVIIDVNGWAGKGNTAAGGAVNAIQPNRILDSRTSVGGRNGDAWSGGETAKVNVLGVNGLPAQGVSAVFANITVVPSVNTQGHITAYPYGATRPDVSTVSVGKGLITANMALIPIGDDGAISIYCNTGSMHVIIDVQGLVADGNPASSLGVQSLLPARILDTRTNLGGHNGRIPGQQSIKLQVLGKGGVPNSGVAAVVAHVTVTGPTNSGYFTVFPSGYARPTASTLNYATGKTVSNDAVVPIGPDGAIEIYTWSSAHAIVDIQGWIEAPELDAAGPSVQFDTTELTASDSQLARQALINSNRYAMTTWWNGAAQTLLSAPVGPDGAANEASGDAMRRLGMEALSLGTSLATGVYDESATGVSRSTALQRTIQLIDRVSGAHATNNPGGWGEWWQSPMWSAITGRAAWYIWPDLPASTKANVARMVAHEANYAARQRIHYMRNASGTIIDAGDSGADDDSWWAAGMQIAIVMLPSHPRVNVWQTEMVHFSLAAWARPLDVSSQRVVNGATLANWLDGSNVESNGVVVDHDRIASDYSTLTYQNLDAVPLFAMADLQVPQAAVDLLSPVYDAFTGVTFSSPPYASPGGSTYTPGSGAIYYPEGNDWGTGQRLPYALSDAQASAYGFGNSTAAAYESLHINAHLALQARFGDGRTYASNQEYNYIGREEHTAQLASQLYLTKYLRDHGLVDFTNNSYWQ